MKIKDQEQVRRNKKFGKRQGIANKENQEASPIYKRAPNENVNQGENGSFIVLGMDRPNNEYSGEGGRGATKAARVDLIAGLNSSVDTEEGRKYNPNFSTDAARIYITQKGHIDRYMSLADTPRQSPRGRSAVGIKADALRLHAREDIKIVTGRARIEGADKDGEKLSNGGANQTPGTISLVAGNYTGDERKVRFNLFNPLKTKRETVKKLQPVPKGENLRECLESIIDSIARLSAIVGTNSSMIRAIDAAVAAHTHQVTPGITPPHLPIAAPPLTSPTNIPGYFVSPLTQASFTASEAERRVFNMNLNTLKTSYLNENFSPIHINSKHVFTT